LRKTICRVRSDQLPSGIRKRSSKTPSFSIPPKYSALEKSTRRPSIISMKPTSFTSEFAILHQTVLLCEPEWR